jgi:glycerol kinase
MRAGVYPEAAEFAGSWELGRRFEPAVAAVDREAKYAGWKDAVGRTLTAGSR